MHGQPRDQCIPGKSSNLSNGQNLHLKCHPQLKPKEEVEDGESQFGNIIRKSTVNKDEVVVQISITVFFADHVCSSSSLWYSEGDKPTNGDSSYKYKCFFQKGNSYLVFRFFLRFFFFLESNQFN